MIVVRLKSCKPERQTDCRRLTRGVVRQVAGLGRTPSPNLFPAIEQVQPIQLQGDGHSMTKHLLVIPDLWVYSGQLNKLTIFLPPSPPTGKILLPTRGGRWTRGGVSGAILEY
jgi:hypothetical protein